MSPVHPCFQPRVLALEPALAARPLPELLGALGAPARRPVLFDGGLGLDPPWSVLAFDPLGGPAPRSIAGLRRLLQRLERGPGDEVPGPFQGGFAGALAYELGEAAETGLRLPPDPWRMPRVVGGLYTDFLVRDDRAGRTWLVLGECPGDGRPALEERRGRVLAALRARPTPLDPCRPDGPLQRLVPPAEHARRIEKVRERIAAGEVYQANLSHRTVRAVRGDPRELYLRLRALHPAACAGYCAWPGGALLSASPELLLEVAPDVGRLARTRPIKGTAARNASPEADRRAIRTLLASEKDLAELAMIVDLERHDLARVALPGSVRVEAFPVVESLASVHHLVGEVAAPLGPGRDAIDALAALFPGGSITGAPKLRSMEVIAELEGEGRGFAYGSQAWIDTRGALRARLLIRTLLWRPRRGGGSRGEVTFRVGGGITWRSVAEDEERETQDKGRLLAQALDSRP
jgi:para-aminobenzoate synthetase component 1